MADGVSSGGGVHIACLRRRLSAFAGLVFVLSLLWSVVGCIGKYELPATCNLDLEFHYEFNPPNEELLPHLVGNIEVYAFDQATQLLVDIIRISKADIDRGHVGAELPSGTYTFVCWASDSEDMSLGGYFPSHMSDPASNVYSDIRIGVTSYTEFRMMLACVPGAVAGELVPSQPMFDDLFFSISPNVTVDDSRNATIVFNFICDTNLLKVRIKGIEHLQALRARGGVARVTRASDDLPSVFVTAPHERYTYSNSLAPYSRQVRFELPATYVDASTMEVDIKVQRLELATYLDRPVMLFVQDPVTGENLVTPIDVVRTIYLATDSGGSHPYQSQTAIDEQYEFEIEVLIEEPADPNPDPDDIRVRVTVNGYTVVYLTPEV